MRVVLLVLGVAITLYASIPYIIDVLRKRTKPRVVSWFNWSLLAGISGAAALSAKQYPSAILSIAIFIECISVVIFGLKLGDKKFDFFDVVCQVGAIIGLLLWIIFNSPLIAIIASVGVDYIASLPTFRHIWQKPHEETVSAFIMSGLGAAFVLAAVHKPHATGLIVPISIIFINALTTSLFFVSPNRHNHS